MPLFAFTELFQPRLPSLLSAWVWFWLLAAPDQATLFRDGVSVSEYEGATEAAVRADAAVPTVSYVRGPDLGGGVGGLVASLRYAGAGQAPLVRYNLSNGRGDVVAQTDASGTVTWTGSYEGFGTRTAETGTNLDRQRANTKEEDPTGLLNEGFRYRDLETGTWLSRDPAGFVDGPNLYAYVKCNPWSKFDPLGLWEAMPMPANATFGQKMGVIWENAKNGFGSLSSEYSDGLANAKQQVREAPIPNGLKLIAKAGLIAGEAGHGSNPLIAAPALVDTAEALISDPVGTVTGMVEGAVDEFREDPEMGAMKLAALPLTIKGVKGAKAEKKTSSQARREAMRQEGIPTSQQPSSQSRNASGREQSYEVPKPGGGTQTKSVQQQTMDSSHPGQGHWEAGKVKTDPLTGETRMNEHGRPKLTNDKSKVDYDD